MGGMNFFQVKADWVYHNSKTPVQLALDAPLTEFASNYAIRGAGGVFHLMHLGVSKNGGPPPKNG